MDKKKVLFLSVNDWANSGYKMCEAINRHSEKYHAEYFVVYNHKFSYERKNVLVQLDEDQVEHLDHEVFARLTEWNDTCDVIHMKEDMGVIKKVNDLAIRLDKPIVASFTGSRFNKHWRHHNLIFMNFAPAI